MASRCPWVTRGIAALAAAGAAAGVGDAGAALNRLSGLGLLTGWGEIGGVDHAAVDPLARPLVPGELSEDGAQTLASAAILPLAKAWRDEDGDFPDWIELHNPADEPVDLAGFGLSDDSGDPFKWSFPKVAIAPGAHLLVFASGKDRRDLHQPNPAVKRPADIPGLRLWLDATNTDSLTADAEGRVSRWQSATGITAAQTDITRQPQRATDPLSGLPVLRFDGLDDRLSFQLLNDVRTVFVVAREDAHATSSFRAVLGENSTADFTRGGDRVLYFHPHSGFAGEDSAARIDGSPVNPTAARWPRSLCLVTSVAARRLQASLVGSDRFVPDRNWHGDIGEIGRASCRERV